MSESRTFKIESKAQIANSGIGTYLQGLDYGKPWMVIVKPWQDKRSLEQNALMWAMLTDISQQVTWFDHKLSPENWKDVFTAALYGQKGVPGINGELVMLGARTSKLSIKKMGELIDIMNVFGIAKEVKWSAPDYYDEQGYVK